MSGKDTQSSLKEWLRENKEITNLQGKEFVLFGGLLGLAHTKGLTHIETKPVHIDYAKGTAVFSARVKGDRGEYVGHGDASPQNLSKMVKTAFIRMAETRSIARALRFYLGIGMTAKDELPGDDYDSDGDQGHSTEPRTLSATWKKIEEESRKIGLPIDTVCQYYHFRLETPGQ